MLSVGLIFLVLLSSAEWFSCVDLKPKAEQDQATMQLFEKSNDVKQEFREAFKINLSEEIRSDADVISNKLLMYCLNTFHHLQYSCYQQEFLSRNPSKKLFIDFGALII